jgi:hypothetical protein
MTLLGWLAAGFGDVVAIIVLLITVFLWILNQAAAKAAEANKRQQPKAPQRPRPAAPPQRVPQRAAPAEPAGRQPPPGDPVEAFLRRAAEQRAPRPAVPPRPEPELVVAQPTAAEVREPPRSSVADHVQRFLDSREFEERADRLGDDVEHAADDIIAHLQAVFDRPLGTLGDMDSGSAAAAAEPVSQVTTEMAGDIVQLLRNPTSVRNAIVMQEILRRPELPVPGVRRSTS